jgi:tRNA(fMet)-specific endonuclease VapC
MLAATPDQFGLSALVEHELRYGLLRNPATKTRTAIEALMAALPTVAFTANTAARAAQLRVSLATKGLPIGPYDVLIAATALEHQLTLITHNTREFERVDGLLIEDWMAA